MTNRVLFGVLVWLALLAGLAVVFDESLNPNQAEDLGGSEIVELQRDPSGHYRAEAFINGVKVPVIVDTGATGVAISEQLAARLGLQSKTAIRANTATGVSIGYAVRLTSVKLGGIEAKDVGAAIVPGLGNEVLLGMSFLGRMDIRLYQGTMTIKQEN
jgi:aspartyl protease family protein